MKKKEEESEILLNLMKNINFIHRECQTTTNYDKIYKIINNEKNYDHKLQLIKCFFANCYKNNDRLNFRTSIGMINYFKENIPKTDSSKVLNNKNDVADVVEYSEDFKNLVNFIFDIIKIGEAEQKELTKSKKTEKDWCKDLRKGMIDCFFDKHIDIKDIIADDQNRLAKIESYLKETNGYTPRYFDYYTKKEEIIKRFKEVEGVPIINNNNDIKRITIGPDGKLVINNKGNNANTITTNNTNQQTLPVNKNNKAVILNSSKTNETGNKIIELHKKYLEANLEENKKEIAESIYKILDNLSNNEILELIESYDAEMFDVFLSIYPTKNLDPIYSRFKVKEFYSLLDKTKEYQNNKVYILICELKFDEALNAMQSGSYYDKNVVKNLLKTKQDSKTQEELEREKQLKIKKEEELELEKQLNEYLIDQNVYDNKNSDKTKHTNNFIDTTNKTENITNNNTLANYPNLIKAILHYNSIDDAKTNPEGTSFCINNIKITENKKTIYIGSIKVNINNNNQNSTKNKSNEEPEETLGALNFGDIRFTQKQINQINKITEFIDKKQLSIRKSEHKL